VGQEGDKSTHYIRVENPIEDIKTEVVQLSREEPGGNLFTAQAVSGVKVARAWSGLLHGTCEPVTLMLRPEIWEKPEMAAKGELQAAETARGRVLMRSTGADRPVVAMKPGNAGGAKGAGYPDLIVGQP